MVDSQEYKRAKDFLAFLIDCFYKSAVSDNNKELLYFLFKKNVAQNELNDFLSKWDIEVVGAEPAFFLAYYMKKHPELEFPVYVKPRLEGLLNYYRFKTIKYLNFFAKSIKILNDFDIVPVLTGDIAIKAINSNQHIEHIALIIQQQEYEKVIKALRSFNCGLFKDKNLIKVSFDKTFSFDIIFKYDLDTRFKYLKDFIERLCTKKVKDSLFEAKFILPDKEDIAFIELIELAKNIKNNTSFNSMVLSLMKLKFLIENNKDFSWEKVINTAKETRTGVQLKLSAMFISDIVPDIIPDVLRDDNLFDKETIEYYNWVKFRKIYNEKVRHDYKEYTLIFLFKSIYENLKVLINVFKDCALNIINFIKGLFYFVFGILNVTKNILLCFAKYFHAKIRFIYCKLIKNNSVLTAKYVNKVEKEPESET